MDSVLAGEPKLFANVFRECDSMCAAVGGRTGNDTSDSVHSFLRDAGLGKLSGKLNYTLEQHNVAQKTSTQVLS